MLKALALATALSLPAIPVTADVPEGVVSVELLPGWRNGATSHMAALRISLAPGWKTYWRAPGDAGIPPEFAWAQAENVTGLRPHWPVPEVTHVNGMRSIVYSGNVVIPLEFTTNGPGPATVAGDLELGVCSDICIPVHLPVSAQLPAEGDRTPEIVAALVDRPATEAEAGVGAVRCRLSPTGDGMTISAEIEMPPAGGTETVVIEAGDPAIWVSEPVASRSGGTLKAEAQMSAGAGMAIDRSALRFTVLGRDKAVDIVGCAD